ncbi:FMN-binding protein [Myxococcota bacterium]|nr:FMN-binding protein [Myxococcota bacterium]MBU1536057.1 FMN-binding protein [Myxococcota bacterium]
MAVKLSVQVKGHRINHVEIHKHSTGRKRSEQVLKRVVAAQSLKVDAVSGATASSKMLLKTIEKALLSAVSQQPGHKQSPSPGQPVAPPNG